jgi:hypothetical protein
MFLERRKSSLRASKSREPIPAGILPAHAGGGIMEIMYEKRTGFKAWMSLLVSGVLPFLTYLSWLGFSHAIEKASHPAIALYYGSTLIWGATLLFAATNVNSVKDTVDTLTRVLEKQDLLVQNLIPQVDLEKYLHEFALRVHTAQMGIIDLQKALAMSQHESTLVPDRASLVVEAFQKLRDDFYKFLQALEDRESIKVKRDKKGRTSYKLYLTPDELAQKI